MGRGDLLRRWEGRASEAEGEKSVTGCEGQRRTAQGLATVPGRAVNDEPDSKGQSEGRRAGAGGPSAVVVVLEGWRSPWWGTSVLLRRTFGLRWGTCFRLAG